MKALTILQPYTGLIAIGDKDIEIRSRRTKYRGDLLLCAGLQIHPHYKKEAGKVWVNHWLNYYGYAVCIARLEDCRPYTLEDVSRASGANTRLNYKPGMYAWVFTNIRKIEPFKVKGQQGFFNVELPSNFKQLAPNYTGKLDLFVEPKVEALMDDEGYSIPY